MKGPEAETDVPILAASPDGRFKVSYARFESGGRIRLSGERICLFKEGGEARSLTPHLNWDVMCAAFSGNDCLALGLEPHPELYPYVNRLDETIAILDLHGDGEFTFIEREIDLRNAPPSVQALAFSDDGTLLVAGGWHGVAVWDMASCAVVRAIAPVNDRPEHVGVLAVSADNGTIAFAMRTGAVLLCPTFGDRKPFTLVAGGSAVDTIGFPDPMTVAASFADGSTRRWNVASGRELSSELTR
jgi:WD40 repeat protein